MSAVYRERYKFRRKQEEMKKERDQRLRRMHELKMGKPDKNGKILVSEEMKTIKIKGKPHQCSVKIYKDGTQAIAIKKSLLDAEARALVSDIQARQKKGENIMDSFSSLNSGPIKPIPESKNNPVLKDYGLPPIPTTDRSKNTLDRSNYKSKSYYDSLAPDRRQKKSKKTAIPDELPPIPRPDPSLKHKPPCKYTVYGKRQEQIFIQSQDQLEPTLEIEDCLGHLKKHFKNSGKELSIEEINEQAAEEMGDIDTIGQETLMASKDHEEAMKREKLTFSIESFYHLEAYKKLELDHKWSQNVQITFENDKMEDNEGKVHQVEDTKSNPLVHDLLDTTNQPEETIKKTENLKKLRQKIQECSLEELSEVLLPVLVEKITPADVLISHSKCTTDSSKINLNKLNQHLTKCKRNLSWIKNNSRSVESENPPEKVRRAVLTVDEDNANVDTLLFDDENQIDITDVKLEMQLAVDAIKMLGTSTADFQKNSTSNSTENNTKDDTSGMVHPNHFYRSENFKSFQLGPSTWGKNTASDVKNLPQAVKTEFMQRVGNLADLECEYIFSHTAIDDGED